MIITRTPFRYTLGGGGTDLPSYYEKFGGFVLSAAIDKYMYINLNQPALDPKIRVKYTITEIVDHVHELKHELAREALLHFNIHDTIEIISLADISHGTGLGSSSCYLVGLLHALGTLQRQYIDLHTLSELACDIEIRRLKKPIGKQDQYMATYGGLNILTIKQDGIVEVNPIPMSFEALDELQMNTLLFFTGISRSADQILSHQHEETKKNNTEVIDSLHLIKEIGYQILDALTHENIDDFGLLMDKHWEAKKKLSNSIASPFIHEIYSLAKEHGALGGKITGAGGGGFFVFYVPQKHHQVFRRVMKEKGLPELRYNFDFDGTKVLVNLKNYGRKDLTPRG